MIKKFVKLTIILFTLTIGACSNQNISEKIKEVTTPDGHIFQYKQMKDAKDISISVAWKNDLMFSGEINATIPHIALNAMLSGGAGGISPAEFAANFQDLNSSAYLFSSPGYIRGVIKTNEDNLDELAKIVNLVLIKPDFNEDWLKRIKNDLSKRVAEFNKLPDFKAGEIARNIIFGNSPLEDYWSTPIELINSITRDDVIAYHKSSFATDNIMISAASSLDSEIIAKAIDVMLKGLPATSLKSKIKPVKFNMANKTIILVDENVKDATLTMVGTLPNIKAQQDFETLIALNILGISDQSRLFKTIREEQRATYSFGSAMIDFTRSNRVLVMSGKVDMNNIEQTISLIKSTYDEFKNKGVTKDEFLAVQKQFLAQVEANMSKPEVSVNAMSETQIDGFSLELVNSLTKMVADLNQNKINKFIANEFVDFDNLLHIYVVPDASNIKADCVIYTLDEIKKCL